MADITWSELVPPPPGCASYYISIGWSISRRVEYYELHVYQFTDQEEEDWHLALYLPLLASPGRLVEYRKQFWGPLDEAKRAIESGY